MDSLNRSQSLSDLVPDTPAESWFADMEALPGWGPLSCIHSDYRGSRASALIKWARATCANKEPAIVTDSAGVNPSFPDGRNQVG